MSEFQTKFLHTRIRVRDIDRSSKFYGDLFGFTEVHRGDSPSGNKLCFLKLPASETLIELCYTEGVELEVPEDLMHFGFSVQDLHEFRKKWEPTGIKFWPEEGPVNDHLYFIDDPDGYEVEILKA